MTGRGDLPSTVDPSDIRGLVTTGHRSVREQPRSSVVRPVHESRALSTVEDSPRTVAGADPSSPVASRRRSGHRYGLRSFDEARRRPQERDQLTCDRGNDFVVLLAAGPQSAKAAAESDLGLPREVLDGRRLSVEPTSQVGRAARRMSKGPGCFDETPPDMSVAGLGDRSRYGGSGRLPINDGTKPTKPITYGRARSNRVRSPSSAATVVGHEHVDTRGGPSSR